MGWRGRSGLWVAAVGAASAIAAAPATMVSGSTTSTRVHYAVSDAWVRSSDHRFVAHRADRLLTGGRPIARAYLRFVVPDAPGPIVRATLRLRALRTSRRGFDVRLAAPSRWNARRITFRSAPRIGSILARSGRVVARRSIAVDVTAAVRTGGRDVTFVLTSPSRKSVAVAARGARPASAPRLEVLRGPVPPSPSPPVSAPPPPVVAPPAPVAPGLTDPPTITSSGRPRITLTADLGTWTGTDPVSYAYQWERCATDGTQCAPIAGESGKVHAVGHDDIGRTVRISVTASNAGGSTTATSQPTPVLAPADAGELPPPTRPVTITGTTMHGRRLTARPATWTWRKGVKAQTDTFQWLRCDDSGAGCTPVASGGKNTYDVAAEDVGARMRVVETVVDTDGLRGTTTSTATSIVEAMPVHAPGDPILIGAGDIADGGSGAAESARIVSNEISRNPGNVTVYTLGDNAYPDGSASDFATQYDPTWGRFKSITKPVPGNHEYQVDSSASGYFGYFGSQAGPSDKGYYAYTAGAWRIYALNSDTSHSESSAQVKWLQSDLAAHSLTKCVLAYWHEPLFAGMFSETSVRPFWKVLYDAGADVILSAHDHIYERWAPMTPDGVEDPLTGITQFIVGTGGAEKAPNASAPPARLITSSKTGVLELTLHPDSFDFSFLTSSGSPDSGQFVRCH